MPFLSLLKYLGSLSLLKYLGSSLSSFCMRIPGSGVSRAFCEAAQCWTLSPDYHNWGPTQFQGQGPEGLMANCLCIPFYNKDQVFYLDLMANCLCIPFYNKDQVFTPGPEVGSGLNPRGIKDTQNNSMKKELKKAR